MEVAEEEDERGRVFHWAREKRLWLYVTAFFIVSILIHGSGFYLFQVVYPSPVRKESDPEKIAILDASNPSVRAVLQRVSDRTIYLKPPSTASNVRIRLKDNPVRFTPAFQETSIPLEPLHFSWTTHETIEPLEIQHSGALISGKLTVRLSESLRSRGIAPWSIMKDYFSLVEALPELRIELKVLPDGSVTVSSIESELNKAEEEELKGLVESTLRFFPGTTEDSGAIEIFSEA